MVGESNLVMGALVLGGWQSGPRINPLIAVCLTTVNAAPRTGVRTVYK